MATTWPQLACFQAASRGRRPRAHETASGSYAYPYIYIRAFIYTHPMGVKTITVSEDAYEALAALKREGESFSDVVRRLARTSRSLLEFAGDWESVSDEAMRDYLEFLRASDELSKVRLGRLTKGGGE